ncbi:MULTISPECIES: hypothetical protein [unclassified Streptomyces]|uniref:hypothetical protein n=1 Tax=unclassified Streptomyces TaxID=2593676 RepID=UPI001CBB99EF|nr:MULTISPECIES: hypothetical protein [unclassified Streptomyces]WPO76691.1 hypothetical protein R9806_39375 [Streptomyces sp. KN37]
MDRKLAASLALLPLVLIAACSSSDEGSSGPTSSVSQPSRTGDASPAPSRGDKVEKSLRLPAHPKYLVPVRNGAGSEDLPDFTPAKKVYTVHVKCSGVSTMQIIKRERPKDNPSRIDCKSPVTIGRVYIDPSKQKLAVQAGDNARWALAIVDGQRPF